MRRSLRKRRFLDFVLSYLRLSESFKSVAQGVLEIFEEMYLEGEGGGGHNVHREFTVNCSSRFKKRIKRNFTAISCQGDEDMKNRTTNILNWKNWDMYKWVRVQ